VLTTQQILRTLPNLRPMCKPNLRRTFRTEEIEQMLEVAKDPAEVFLIHFLREIGLRHTALAHIQYEMLLDANHLPRRECRVPEKGRTLRTFLLSPNLQKHLTSLSALLRARFKDDELKTCFVFNLSNPKKPCLTINYTLKRLAHDAGITDVIVHPHAFRHTLVGDLIKAGNSLSLVSKFMGHASVNTTFSFYWIPSSEELEAQMINPFDTSDQKTDQKKEDKFQMRRAQETEELHSWSETRIKACRRMIEIMWNACDKESKEKILQQVPNMQNLLAMVDEDFEDSQEPQEEVVEEDPFCV
jgi:hypothetical protein